jgi:hypothetical protein
LEGHEKCCAAAQEYLYFASDLLRFKPDLVVAYDGWNDIFSDYQNPFRTTDHRENDARLAQSYSMVGSANLVAENLRYFLTQSAFNLGMVELPWRKFRKLFCRSYNAPHWFSDNGDLKQAAPFDPSTMGFYRRIRQAFLALTDDELSVALFLQPLVGVDDRMLSSEEKASWWYPQRNFLFDNRIPFYEHARRILADLKEVDQGNRHQCIADLSHSLKGVTEPVYADSGHLLPKGNEIVAAQMLDELVMCGLLRRA